MATTAPPPAPRGSRLVIVRHGEAVSNAEDIVAGHGHCKGLTDLGRRQAAALAARLRATQELAGAAALWSSVLPRAVETAEILAPALGGLGLRQSCDLCEMHVGEADGMTWSDYEAAYGLFTPIDDPDRELAPGGESWAGFLGRAEKGLLAVLEESPGELVVVVAHGGVVGASMVRFLGLDRHGAGVRTHADNTSITEWVHNGSRWWLVRYNDATHLDVAEWGAGGLRLPTPAWVRQERAQRV